MNGAVAGDSATWRKKFTSKQWAELIGFCGVETRKHVQNNWKHTEKARDATEVCTIVVPTIKEQQVDVDRQSIRVWFGDDVVKDIWKYRFTYGPISNMENYEWGISIMVFIGWNAQKIWDIEETELEKQAINHITPDILKKFQRKHHLLPTSYNTKN